MMSWYGGPGWVGWLLMTLILLGFWTLVIFGGMALYRSLRTSDHSSAAPRRDRLPSAEQLLEERFARGEIDAEEFTRRRDVLRSGRLP